MPGEGSWRNRKRRGEQRITVCSDSTWRMATILSSPCRTRCWVKRGLLPGKPWRLAMTYLAEFNWWRLAHLNLGLSLIRAKLRRLQSNIWRMLERMQNASKRIIIKWKISFHAFLGCFRNFFILYTERIQFC